MEGVLVIDVETNGIGSFRPPRQTVIQVGMILNGSEHVSFYVKGVKSINPAVPHSITIDICDREGKTREEARQIICTAIQKCHTVVGHNVRFDLGCIENTFGDIGSYLEGKDVCCTMLTTVDVCKIPFKNAYPGSTRYKFPRLEELYEHLHKRSVPDSENLHDALEDCKITLSCYKILVGQNI